MIRRRAGLSRLAELERRYDALPEWARREKLTEIERLERKVAAMERLMRENDRVIADNLERMRRLRARYERNRVAFAAALEADRAALRLLRAVHSDEMP
jgi:hypothetical protein